jgi:hypothetical protein
MNPDDVQVLQGLLTAAPFVVAWVLVDHGRRRRRPLASGPGRGEHREPLPPGPTISPEDHPVDREPDLMDLELAALLDREAAR